MIIIPAIDILQGKVVRLHQGDFEKQTVYSDNPVDTALMWQDKGAEFLHIVDLDGARYGRVVNSKIIEDIVSAVDIPCEVGGGLRDHDNVASYIDKGVSRLVFSTKAFENLDYLKELCSEFKQKIVVSIDFLRQGYEYYVAKTGWVEKTSFTLNNIIEKMEKAGVSTIVVTDISRDGTLKGPNVAKLKEILDATSMSVIASGGISCIDDIEQLNQITSEDNLKKIEAVIVGRALYENTFDLTEALKKIK